ncbi:DUF2059 domain-containing protein [Rheinheimera texasensis]|uniref:DUF2059 domain-containing protein n=1 Tax=Rheinheimera texasensis TaxID=306205 RepID=UPI0032B22AC5
MRIKLLSCAAALLFSLQAQAEPATRATIEKFLQVTEAANMMDQAYQNMDQMTAQMLASSGLDTKRDKQIQQDMQEMNALVRAELSWDKMEEPLIALYGSVFSEAELQDIIAFYQSDAGQKMLKRQPELIQGTMVMMQEQMQTLMPKIKALSEKQRAARKAAQQKNSQ